MVHFLGRCYTRPMFTGLVEAIGTVTSVESASFGKRMALRVPSFVPFMMGESIAVNGACLTLASFEKDTFSVEVIHESLEKTTLGRLQLGDKVHLERALQMNDRFGGHFVQGHVDGVGVVEALDAQADRVVLRLRPQDRPLLRYVSLKGSITVHGVSLTVTQVGGDFFEVELIPHTLEQTLLGQMEVGGVVNLEVDVLARITERLLQAGNV